MQLSFSNIAWDLSEEDAVAALLRDKGFSGVDIAPGKYFPEPAEATPAALAEVRARWADRGLRIHGMQALLFGTSHLNLFDDPADTMLDRLAAVCRIGGGVGARALTFGSPRQRDRSGLEDAQALEIAVRFFRRLGERAADAGVVLCLEPNPAAYNCNFMTTTQAAIEVVAAVDHPAIRLQIDIGSLAMNEEPAGETIALAAPHAGHVHASEPMLATVGDGDVAHHQAAAAALRAHVPGHVVTIEMARSASGPALDAVARAADFALSCYGAPA